MSFHRLSQNGRSTELISKKDSVGGRQMPSSWSDKDAGFGQLTVVASMLQFTTHTGQTM